MSKPFASSADLEEKQQTIEELAPGVWALTSEGDPNIGAIEAEDFVICFEARATPAAVAPWVEEVRRRTGDKPIRHLVLSHYHAVRTLGAAAFDAENVICHQATAQLIEERGRADWDSEFGRMPRLFKEPDSIPGLTHPTVTFADRMTLDLGGDRGTLVLEHHGRGHTAGDLVAWLPRQRVLFAGDLVEAEAALYTGDAFHRDWSTTTLDAVASLGAVALVGGRGAVVHGSDQVARAISQTRNFLQVMLCEVGPVHEAGEPIEKAFRNTHRALEPTYGHWPIFEHCLPFNVARLWDEFSGTDWPEVWTAARDREIWDRLQG